MDLEDISQKIRILSLKAVSKAGVGHLGGAFLAAEILAELYFDIMNVKPEEPTWEGRDRFILSKDHDACLALYSTLALKNYFPEEWLWTFVQPKSYLQKHSDMNKTPGVDFSTGSLGRGASIAAGIALAGKMDNSNYKVFALTGDGELQEGQVWEATLFASQHNLDNLMHIIDYNGLQLYGMINNILNLALLKDKFRSFGFDVKSIDGHNLEELKKALDFSLGNKKPKAIICKTVKRKVVSFMENVVRFHSDVPNEEECKQAIEGLGGE